jgi:hypothetical protein
MAAYAVCVSSELDIFADILVQTSTDKTVEIAHKPTTSVDKSDLEFTIPRDDNKYIDPNMQIYIKCQLFGAAEAELDEKNYTAGKPISYIPYSVNST